MYGYRRHTTLLGVTLLGKGKEGEGGGQQCSNILIHLGLSCYWNRDKLATVQASIAQVRFYQRGNIGRDSTKRCTLVSLQHLFVPTSPTQTSHGTSEINHDTGGFQPPHFSNNVRGPFTSPPTWRVRMIFHFNDKSEEFANVNYNLFVSVCFYK